jgi:hypothetical protein
LRRREGTKRTTFRIRRGEGHKTRLRVGLGLDSPSLPPDPFYPLLTCVERASHRHLSAVLCAQCCVCCAALYYFISGYLTVILSRRPFLLPPLSDLSVSLWVPSAPIRPVRPCPVTYRAVQYNLRCAVLSCLILETTIAILPTPHRSPPHIPTTITFTTL